MHVPSVPYDGEIPPEPQRRGARVRDAEGDTWRRGTTWWRCEAEVDGNRIRYVAKLHWDHLVRSYGPIQVLDLNDRGRV